mgnify:CR=1 FL=1
MYYFLIFSRICSADAALNSKFCSLQIYINFLTNHIANTIHSSNNLSGTILKALKLQISNFSKIVIYYSKLFLYSWHLILFHVVKRDLSNMEDVVVKSVSKKRLHICYCILELKPDFLFKSILCSTLCNVCINVTNRESIITQFPLCLVGFTE